MTVADLAATSGTPFTMNLTGSMPPGIKLAAPVARFFSPFSLFFLLQLSLSFFLTNCFRTHSIISAPLDESRISCEEIFTVLQIRSAKEKDAKKIVTELTDTYDELREKANKPKWRGVR